MKLSVPVLAVQIAVCMLLNHGVVTAWGDLQTVLFRQETVHDEIRDRISKFQFPEAEKLIEGALADDPHDHDAHMLRRMLANAMMRARRRAAAELQFEKLVDYLLSYPEKSRPMLKHLPQLLINLPYIRENIEPKASQTIDRAIDVFRSAAEQNPANVAFSNGLTMAVGLKARGLLKRSLLAEAQAVYAMELNRLRDRWRSSPENPDSWLRLSNLLKVAEEHRYPGYQKFADQLWVERRSVLSEGASRFPDSNALAREYFSLRMSQAAQLESPSPQAALAILIAAESEFDDLVARRENAKPLLPTKIQIQKERLQIERLLTRRNLIGNVPPAFADVEWLGEGSTNWAQLRGRKVLLIFFSVPTGESILHLIRVHDMISNQFSDVRLVALTHELQQPFNRPAGTKNKQNADTDENRKLYRRKLLSDIVEANGFKFPIGIANDSSRTGSEFGVTQVPMSLLIDESGICRRIFIGADQFGAIAESIESLTDSKSSKQAVSR